MIKLEIQSTKLYGTREVLTTIYCISIPRVVKIQTGNEINYITVKGPNKGSFGCINLSLPHEGASASTIRWPVFTGIT